MKVVTLWLDGLWDRNPALIQMLGLCPLLAVSNTVENAIGLGLATIFVLVLSNASISLIRNLVDDAIRLPVFVLVIAALTTCAELLVQAFDYPLYQSLGIFLPLSVPWMDLHKDSGSLWSWSVLALSVSGHRKH